ncbi:O-fucosyltransferase 27 [Rutidosis leptorrhynchoides]|uniref:O-fucosyltransferase 27 n=1 Tax=Rutidosis leptorrhynchoides TaxID=125765 RepID=UPI003A991940
MKGDVGGKMVIKSKLKWVGLVGLVLSALSLFTHFLLARYSSYTDEPLTEYQAFTIFSWRPIFENAAADLSPNSKLYRRLWGPVRRFEYLQPHAKTREHYAVPVSETDRFIFVRIRGGFHEIRSSICDAVVIARLLNATLVIPEIQSTTSSKGISAQFKSFAYLYNEDQFMAALSNDITVVKTLPKSLKGARRKKEIPSFKVANSQSPYYYLHHVLPVLKRHSVVELVVSDGGCLQAILPPDLEEYQRLRCRVAFHALSFRQEVQELATKILHRLRAPGRPFIAYDPGMTRDALAYYGCAELFQDVHTELIQHRRLWMLKRGIVKGNLTVDSNAQRLNGSCPLMPEEIGIILRAYGYSWDTIIYISGGEVFGGQKKLIPFHAIFENVVDRTSLTTPWELNKIYGREANLVDKYIKTPPSAEKETKYESWKTSGQRPRPLPPPPARPKSYNIEGWWGWVAESDNEPESTVIELRTNAHKLLWEAIDYMVCVEADVFVPGFDRDGKGRPSFASLVMGHRLYQSASAKSFRFDRKEIAKYMEDINDHMYEVNHTWIKSVRRHLSKSLLDGLTQDSKVSKSSSFLSFPVPECSCLRFESNNSSSRASSSQLPAAIKAAHGCPSWMGKDVILHPGDEDDVEDDDNDDDSGLFSLFARPSGGGSSNRNTVSSGGRSGGEMMSSKEETQMDDQEEMDGGDR